MKQKGIKRRRVDNECKKAARECFLALSLRNKSKSAPGYYGLIEHGKCRARLPNTSTDVRQALINTAE